MKLVNNNAKLVTPAQMKDGDIGVIRKWYLGLTSIGNRKRSVLAYIGSIVQKLEGGKLIILGKRSGHHFKDTDKIISDDCLIELLPPGTLLEI